MFRIPPMYDVASQTVSCSNQPAGQASAMPCQRAACSRSVARPLRRWLLFHRSSSSSWHLLTVRANQFLPSKALIRSSYRGTRTERKPSGGRTSFSAVTGRSCDSSGDRFLCRAVWRS